MIHALNAITLVAAVPARALQDYATVLGRSPQPAVSALQLTNTRLTIVQKPAFTDAGLAELTFAAADLDKTRNLLERRAMRAQLDSAPSTEGRRLHVATDSMHGVAISVVERAPAAACQASPATACEGSVVSGLDHVVIRTTNPERAVALYGARLGLSLRLDRTEPSWGARLLFFRCGDLVVEIAHDLKAGISDQPDRLWGLSWRVPDIHSAHARLRAAAVEISQLRAGRRPGTQLFTVRSHTAGVPTIMIGPAKSPT